MTTEKTQLRLLRLSTVLERVALSKTELHRRIHAGTFPKPIKLGPRTPVWPEASITEWIASLQQGAQK